MPLLSPGMTIAQARRAMTEAFRTAGLDSPELDARLLAGQALDLDHTPLTVDSGRHLEERETKALAALAARRLAREPVARILGHKEFWGLEFRITDATLVPRPETETVVEAALATIDTDGRRDRPLRIADLGTGSGAILLALLHELPNATGVGTDISREALATAAENADRLGFAARTEFAAGDFGAALTGRFDLVVSNPPYIATRRDRRTAARRSAAIRWAHSMAASTGSTAIAPLRHRRGGCFAHRAIWWSSLASDRNLRLPRCSARQGSRPHRRGPIWPASPERCLRVWPQ